MSATTAPKGGAKSLPMSVDNVGFLLDRLGQDCAPLQFLRELTQNGIEAIVRKGQPGQIVWDVDWYLYDLAGGPMKLCITDTGDGMTGDEMIRFINQLSASGGVQSFSQNYGVGAKIAAATRNPAGVLYHSWKEGEGSQIHLRKDPETGEYGLRQFELADGDYAHYFPLEDALKPEIIGNHGTKVILFGISNSEQTIDPPEGAPSPSRWISKYLNTRYFRFPEGVTVKAREGWDAPRSDTNRNVLRTITGQKAYLDGHCEASGCQPLSEARVHWWILKEEPAISSNSGFIESGGHFAALYQDELYDRYTARSGTAQLQQFGIIFGTRQVVLYVEPCPKDSTRLTTNTARTSLLLDGDRLPLADWAYEFRENLPKKLKDFINDKAAAVSEHDHLKNIKERLKAVMDLYKVSRYKPVPAGMYLSDPTSSIRVGTSDGSGSKSKGGGGTGASVGSSATGMRDGELGDVYHLFQKVGGTSSDKREVDPFPRVQWISIKEGTRAEGDIEDRAAKFLADQNLLLINADFRVFEDMTKRLIKDKEKDTGSGMDLEGVVRPVVHQWFEQALVETVIGVQQLKGSKEWGPKEIEAALASEALTATVMQRYHVHIACKRDLGAKLGKLKDA